MQGHNSSRVSALQSQVYFESRRPANSSYLLELSVCVAGLTMVSSIYPIGEFTATATAAAGSGLH